MSRWIDADALHDALKAKQKWVVRCGDKHNEGYTYDQIHFAIDSAPSIEIIRCRECKWRDDAGKKRALICTNPYIDVDPHPNFFCGYGEREGE